MQTKMEKALSELWIELMLDHKYKVVQLCYKAERLELVGKTVRWKTPFHSNGLIHESVVAFLKTHGVKVEKG